MCLIQKPPWNLAACHRIHYILEDQHATPQSEARAIWMAFIVHLYPFVPWAVGTFVQLKIIYPPNRMLQYK